MTSRPQKVAPSVSVVLVSLIAALFFLMLFLIPRSPRWLVKKGRIAEAGKVLTELGDSDEQEDLRQIVASIDAEHAGASGRRAPRSMYGN